MIFQSPPTTVPSSISCRFSVPDRGNRREARSVHRVCFYYGTCRCCAPGAGFTDRCYVGTSDNAGGTDCANRCRQSTETGNRERPLFRECRLYFFLFTVISLSLVNLSPRAKSLHHALVHVNQIRILLILLRIHESPLCPSSACRWLC